ncbi:MAG: flagellar biosynthesis protein FlhA [Puniceicoccaceae bacterium]|nr:MAG: flagellar biosynthesis protein FlhA [Puniceicoccaceae bacterium]
MMAAENNTLLDRLARFKRGDLLIVFGLFGTVLLLVMPLPAVGLDLLLATSIGLSLLVLLVIVYVKYPPEFSAFPTILLGLTLFRLGLNVASTRLILLDGYAGNVIEAFGSFVVRQNYVVGAVVFLILVLINFIVITKGAGRIAEVAARFTLDAMPGKQMAIDAELNAGIIDEAAATSRRQKIQKEADFYGAMDGASKFVRGDAMAGLLITMINVVGGIAIGVLQMGLPVAGAMQKFTLLSIGDGLVSQIPALIISLSAGILVTRTNEKENLGSHITRQVTAYPRAIGVLAVMLFLFALIPGMPATPFLTIAAIVGLVALVLRRSARLRGDDPEEDSEETAKPATGAPAAGEAPAASPTAELEKLIEVDLFALEIGFNLLGLADRSQGGDLLERVTGVRKNLARELGLVVPPIAVRDNMELDSNEYRLLLRNKEVARGKLVPRRWLAMNVGGSQVQLKGVPTVEPVFGIPAVWIADEEKKTAEINGYSIVDPSSVLVTHLSETLKQVAHHLIGRQDTQQLLDHVKQKHPTLVSELLPDLVSIGIIQRVLQNLLKEGIPIRNLTLILEAVADFAPLSKNPDDLSEQVRRRLGEFFVTALESEPGMIKALTLDPKLEQILAGKVQRTPTECTLSLDPATAEYLLKELGQRIPAMMEEGLAPILVVSAEIRLPFKRFFEPSLPKLTVLSFQELPARTDIQTVSIILLPQPSVRPAPAELAAVS